VRRTIGAIGCRTVDAFRLRLRKSGLDDSGRLSRRAKNMLNHLSCFIFVLAMWNIRLFALAIVSRGCLQQFLLIRVAISFSLTIRQIAFPGASRAADAALLVWMKMSFATAERRNAAEPVNRIGCGTVRPGRATHRPYR
jgi:hypothetical protein